MAKDKDKDKDKKKNRDRAKAEKVPVVGHAAHEGSGKATREHHAAKAHGRATQVDTSLPATRPELMALHAAARARRNGAELDSPAFRAAITDLERIEIRIAAVDRAADPPLG
jgi:hypothetical protein